METPNSHHLGDEASTLMMMNTPQFLNYVSTNTSSSQDMLSSPIASNRFHPSSSLSTIEQQQQANTTSSINNNNKSSTMMNMALTMLLLSPSKQNSLLHTPTKSNSLTIDASRINHDNEMLFSSPLSAMMMDTPRGNSSNVNGVRRTLDFDESMDNFEEVSLSEPNQPIAVIKNTYSQELVEKIGLESNIASNFGESLFVSYFHRMMSLLLAVLLFPTKMMNKEIQSPVIPVERNVNTHNIKYQEENPMLEHFIGKMDNQQKRIDELETIIKKMSSQIEDLINSKVELEKRIGNVEETQKEIPSQPESVDSLIVNPQVEIPEEKDSNTNLSNNSTCADLDSVPKQPIESNSALIFIVLPIMMAIISIL
ncbi:predicted protein [Naegleria gruberi]|uniref:Predicted protein n=1 Tax=Naegleria gruberi TaxID=5762 RepID=D2VEU8_NAEGR|nr:uncharacterized protein NAEGRDRAFT_48962 [Naegleria gruberi]EFC44568.1 predicted protein [Naegleria gruberi]|eukprot:XP_002677312.1 predicted protein [Naegleria gruberi strain NEG-M]